MRREFLDHVLFWNAGDLEAEARRLPSLLQRGTEPCVVGRLHAVRLRGRTHGGPVPNATMCVGSPTAGAWSSFQRRPDDEFETDRRRTSKERVRRLMREHDLQAPQRAGHAHGPKAHDGTITTEAPDVMWGTDMTATVTVAEGVRCV